MNTFKVTLDNGREATYEADWFEVTDGALWFFANPEETPRLGLRKPRTAKAHIVAGAWRSVRIA